MSVVLYTMELHRLLALLIIWRKMRFSLECTYVHYNRFQFIWIKKGGILIKWCDFLPDLCAMLSFIHDFRKVCRLFENKNEFKYLILIQVYGMFISCKSFNYRRFYMVFTAHVFTLPGYILNIFPTLFFNRHTLHSFGKDDFFSLQIKL